mmetsp:Transcript_12162/g.32725  ORF Transcript_12162/g.32725 Transcript_12162/m.32725 type:complete len:473 (-) Transcript_12162:180-1598(-)|eukprot:CAMPEP_0185833718 /NCGR_PEP_ID=MMETSP1353-20130828/3335_1 /TAXON_ID=1077150 /ORGANISM="Erythrolobus australicus, Strain CCMP3124" /LENGTH=472 /DNA_ID=CAMNT_0028532041 /DNA_START=83 /DNA_END=1501 /DNA_ORIENTATION=-
MAEKAGSEVVPGERTGQHAAVVAALKAELTSSMKQIKAKLEMLERMQAKTREQKLDMLFSLWDRDASGALVFSEIAAGIRNMVAALDPESEFSVDSDELLELAADGAALGLTKFGSERKLTVPDGEEPSDAGRLAISREKFAEFIDAVCSRVGTDFEIVAELLVLQYVGWSKEQAVDDAVEFVALRLVEDSAENEIRVERRFQKSLESEELLRLFKHFDRSQDMQVDFKELAMGLDSLRGMAEAPFEESVASALGALLIFDEDCTRTLNYVQFARFMLTFAAAAGCSIEELTPMLLDIATENASSESDALHKAKSMAMDEIMRDIAEADREALTANDVRADALFQLFDRDGSGDVDFKELALGLKLFNPSEGLESAAVVASAMLLAHDKDENQKLDRAEFGRFLVEFCETLGADFDELADYLVVAALVGRSEAESGADALDARRDSAVLTQIQPTIVADIKSAQEELASRAK